MKHKRAIAVRIQASEQKSNRPRLDTVLGFSLVEVTLALGVMAFALVSVVGLIPVGLTSMRTSVDTTIEQQITQAVLGDVQLTDFSLLTDAAFTSQFPRAFDPEGIEVSPGDVDAKYLVEIEVESPIAVPAGSGNGTRDGLARIAITITDQFANRRPTSRSILVANNGF